MLDVGGYLSDVGDELITVEMLLIVQGEIAERVGTSDQKTHDRFHASGLVDLSLRLLIALGDRNAAAVKKFHDGQRQPRAN